VSDEATTGNISEYGSVHPLSFACCLSSDTEIISQSVELNAHRAIIVNIAAGTTNYGANVA
jgi:hypothetical protein